MKILLCNIPIRSTPSDFPPVACTCLFNVLKRHGYAPDFYDINVKRPSFQELSEYFAKEKFDIVGISVVVSTGYKYAQALAACIKQASPQTQIILGGNLAAAYEVVLRKCRVDVCAMGEGERVLLNLVKHWEAHRSFQPNEDLEKIKGLAFLDRQGACRFTGYEELIPAHEIEEPDYELLGKYSDLSQYIQDPLTRADIACDPRSHEIGRRGKKLATIFTEKGCINACTFCHRWVKGYRVIPVEKVIAAMRELIDKYNVGFFSIADECFGEDKRWLESFIDMVRPLDILFQIGGARISLVKKDPGLMRRLKDVGLTAIYFGIESGSEKILDVMHKNATKAQNLAALQMCHQAGVYTVIQLVIGMPGENDRTIDETIDFLKQATGDLAHPPLIAVNYLQTLPGTPCYDFLRHKGLIGKTIEDEERYLLSVSDVNASEFRQYVNVSEAALPELMLWKLKIYLLPVIHWLRRHDWKFTEDPGAARLVGSKRSGAAAVKAWMRRCAILYRIIDLSGGLFWKMMLMKNRCAVFGPGKALALTWGLRRSERRDSFVIKAGPLTAALREK